MTSNLKIIQLAGLLFIVLLASIGYCDAASPSTRLTRFANLPAKVAYVNDASVVFYHDSVKGDVWRSEDEGKTWQMVNGPPSGSAYMLIEHPYDRNMVFILSNAKKHWRSTDQGKTWHPFETPESPAVRAGSPLEFNADEKKYEHIIFTGKKCTMWTPWGGGLCHDEAYYTRDAFATPPQMLVEFLMHCTFAKSSKDVKVKPEHIERIYCIAWEDSPTKGDSTVKQRSHVYDDPSHILSARSEDKNMQKRVPLSSPTRLYYSDDFFKTKKMVTLDLGRDAKHFVGFGPSKKYLVTALRDIQSSSRGNAGMEMALFVSEDGDQWHKTNFPHGAGLTEGAYTIIEGTTNSLVVDVLDVSLVGQTGTLFVSNSKGTDFVKSLEGTSRNRNGIVDYEHLMNIDGVAVANVRADIHFGGETKHGTGTKSLITFNDGSNWRFLNPPAGQCKGKDLKDCSLHLYSVTRPHNVGRIFSSTAPGFVMGVGSVGQALMPYESCDTFLSTDAGQTWIKVADGAHKYEFGDQGNLLLMVNDEESTDEVSYSWNHGKKWEKLRLPATMRAKILTTIPDGTAQKFILIGSQSRKEAGSNKDRQVAIFLDFDGVKRRCRPDDMEVWKVKLDSQQGKSACLMGHTQSYQRRKADADCFVGDKFHEPIGAEEPCPCTEDDYECDFGFVRSQDGKTCEPTTRIRIPPGQCMGGERTFKASSGYRKVAGNQCRGGKTQDEVKSYPCDQGAPVDGQVIHQVHTFPGQIFDHIYFSDSSNVVLQLTDGTLWKSLNDGYSWTQIERPDDPTYPGSGFLTMSLHTYDRTRGFLITNGQRYLRTTNGGKAWHDFNTAPLPPNSLGIPILQFHPTKPDWLIWTGSRGDCISNESIDCRAVSFYTRDNGQRWHKIDEYVRNCMWARASKKFRAPDETAIICESYRDKKGNQRAFDASNPLTLVHGMNFYQKHNKVLNAIEGSAVFDEFMVVAEYTADSEMLTLQISLDGLRFAKANFPPNTKLERRAFTVLDSNTGSVFLHGTTHGTPGSEWGTLFRSNWNGTYYTTTLEHVNRDSNGYVDFEKMLGLEGIALANVVSNPDEAAISGVKKIQTKITHNDAGRWKTLTPPLKDSNGEPYKCQEVGCTLHIHGYTERDDPRATYSSPTAVGVMLAVGNVGKNLAPYRDSDTFLTRDGGFTWEEVHKDAHKWEFGDQGSLLVIVNDEEPTSTVSYTQDEGLTWSEYNFGQALRVSKIVTVPEDTHRKFILFGASPSSSDTAMAVHLDFTGLTSKQCETTKDFETWSPTGLANDQCLFGREVSYYRRKREANCFVGRQIAQPHEVVRNCTCTEHDFECEYNHRPDPNDPTRCTLYPGAQPIQANEEEQCLLSNDLDAGTYWYDRTTVRKVPHSSCQGGLRPDRGKRHYCTMSTRRHSWFWWLSLIITPFGLAALVGLWWIKRTENQRSGFGSIRLPGANGNGLPNGNDFGDNKVLQTLASVPWFIVGTASMVWSTALNAAERLPVVGNLLGNRTRTRASYGGYRTLRPNDSDAEILRDYEEDELED